MTYKVIFSKRFDKQFSKLDKFTQKLILNWIEKNLEETENPKQHGKALKGNLSGYWRYRIGDYRVIAEIIDSELIILMIDAGHRRKIYKN
ncbi:MAG: type II toxin-antitoxin system RelE family toxin [Bacillota bacterium]|jgi:mRNA interferase RelE/StbE